jgi:hypothetical protein
MTYRRYRADTEGLEEVQGREGKSIAMVFIAEK